MFRPLYLAIIRLYVAYRRLLHNQCIQWETRSRLQWSGTWTQLIGWYQYLLFIYYVLYYSLSLICLFTLLNGEVAGWCSVLPWLHCHGHVAVSQRSVKSWCVTSLGLQHESKVLAHSVGTTSLVNKFLFFFNVYWTVHHCDSWRIRDQLDVTGY